MTMRRKTDSLPRLAPDEKMALEGHIGKSFTGLE